MLAPSPSDDAHAKRREVHQKTRLCKFFTMGACTRGSSCAFAHGPEQLRDQPDYSKTRLCADFVQRGRCSRGQACPFAHGRNELRPGSAAKLGRPARSPRPGGIAPRAEETDAVALRALQTLRMQQALHEQAALKLMLCSAGARPSPQCTGKTDTFPPETQTFSRQTTWEGVETDPTNFSRVSSATSSASETVSVSAVPKDVEVLVKNTFIEVKEDQDEDQDVSIRKTRSLPDLCDLE